METSKVNNSLNIPTMLHSLHAIFLKKSLPFLNIYTVLSVNEKLPYI